MAGQTFNVMDFGAKGDGVTVDSAAINAAIVACHNAGGGTVYIPPGTYMVAGDHTNPSVGAIELLSNVTLTGAGMGQTTLKLVDNFNDRINGIVRTSLGSPGETVENATLSNLTIDGNRANNTGHQAAFISGAKDDGSERIQKNIMVDHVEAQNCTAYGFDPHEITTNITIQNSFAHGNGLDGFTADYLVDSTFQNDVAYNNDRHGFNVQNQTTNFTLLNDTAYGNGVGAAGGSGVTVQRGDIIPDGETSIPEDSHINIIGGNFYDNSLSGILVKLADTTTINGANVHDNKREGVRVEAATNTVVENSNIYDNSTETPGAYDAVYILSRYDVPFNQTVYSTNTSVHDNNIYTSSGGTQSRYGIYEAPTNATLPNGSSSGTTLTDDPGTTQSDNTISGMASGAISVPNYTVTTSGTDGNDTLMGSAAGDYLNGLGGNDLISGLAGTDTLLGGAGDDTLDGGSGADSMVGGVGNDIYSVDNTGDVVTENPNEGTDKVLSTITYTLGSNVENLALQGSNTINGYGNELDNVLTGNDGANVLKSYDGNDTLDGGLGADSMTGGNGNDVYIVDNPGDMVFESSGGGTDLVMSSMSYVLPSNVENLTLTGTGNINATGNTLANVLVGNDGSNVLDGGTGPDTMMGGNGNDFYYVDHTGDVVVEAQNAGTDLVYASISYTLGDNVENLTLNGNASINGSGNALNNTITGNSGDNKLMGGLGSDFLTGGAGNDVFIYQSTADSTLAAYDTIADFTQGQDKIDLSAIHASNGLPLTWGGQTTSAVSNQVTWSYDGGGHAIVQADTNGDGVADFKLQLNAWNPSATLTAGDFKLK